MRWRSIVHATGNRAGLVLSGDLALSGDHENSDGPPPSSEPAPESTE